MEGHRSSCCCFPARHAGVRQARRQHCGPHRRKLWCAEGRALGPCVRSRSSASSSTMACPIAAPSASLPCPLRESAKLRGQNVVIPVHAFTVNFPQNFCFWNFRHSNNGTLRVPHSQIIPGAEFNFYLQTTWLWEPLWDLLKKKISYKNNTWL